MVAYSIEAKDLWDAVVKKLGRNDLVFEKWCIFVLPKAVFRLSTWIIKSINF